MRAYVIGESALSFWRRQAKPERFLGEHVDAPLSDCPRSRDELEGIDFPIDVLGDAPVRLMTDCVENRVLENRFGYSICSRTLPATSFCQVSESLCVASPEHCLLQASKTRSLVRLIELCMELCGRYSLAPGARRGFVTRHHALTSIEAIKAFLREMHTGKHAKKLARAIRFVEEGSRSPMETRQYLLLCLPKRHGGYGLPRPELNAIVKLDKCEQRVANRHHLECDMLWPEQKTVVEYDGHEDHESYEARAKDAIKRNILASKGFQVFTLTGRQIRDIHVFDKTARELGRSLGFRLRQFPEDWVTRRALLRHELFRSLDKPGHH